MNGLLDALIKLAEQMSAIDELTAHYHGWTITVDNKTYRTPSEREISLTRPIDMPAPEPEVIDLEGGAEDDLPFC